MVERSVSQITVTWPMIAGKFTVSIGHGSVSS